MRQVNRDELEWVIQYGLQRLKPSVRALMTDRRPDEQRKGRAIAARELAAMLDRYEVLSQTPEPPPFAQFPSGDG